MFFLNIGLLHLSRLLLVTENDQSRLFSKNYWRARTFLSNIGFTQVFQLINLVRRLDFSSKILPDLIAAQTDLPQLTAWVTSETKFRAVLVLVSTNSVTQKFCYSVANLCKSFESEPLNLLISDKGSVVTLACQPSVWTIPTLLHKVVRLLSG